jgi:hypothetical protein
MPIVKILESLKKKALRRGLWFNTLNSIERGIIDICIRIKRDFDVKSSRLLRVLTEIVKKIIQVLKSFSDIESWIKGFRMASQASWIAVSWGYKEAWKWAQDLNYITYLAKLPVYCLIKMTLDWISEPRLPTGMQLRLPTDMRLDK